MMKQPQSGSSRRLSKLCRCIFVLGVFKLCMLGTLLVNFESENDFPISGSLAPAPAHAAETLTPPAPQIRGGTQSPFSQQPTSSSGTAGAPVAMNRNPVNVPMPGNAPVPGNAPGYARPDQPTVPQAPAPTVSPFVPQDSVQRKQEELNRREQELLALQQQMQNRLAELQTIEKRIQSMIKQADDMQDDKLLHLIDVYTNMKAKQAAEVLATLDENISVRILAGMRGKQAGEILSYMQAAPAARLSELLSKTSLPK